MVNISEKRIIKIYSEGDFNVNLGGVNIYAPMLTIFEQAGSEATYASDQNSDRKIITNMIGWDDTSTAIEIVTEPLLLSHGSAIISKRFTERELTIEYSSQVDSPKDVLQKENNTIKYMMLSMEPVVVTREITHSDSTDRRIEALLKCYITSFEVKKATPTDYTVKIVFKVLKPVKKIYSATAGSTSAYEIGESL